MLIECTVQLVDNRRGSGWLDAFRAQWGRHELRTVRRGWRHGGGRRNGARETLRGSLVQVVRSAEFWDVAPTDSRGGLPLRWNLWCGIPLRSAGAPRLRARRWSHKTLRGATSRWHPQLHVQYSIFREKVWYTVQYSTRMHSTVHWVQDMYSYCTVLY